MPKDEELPHPKCRHCGTEHPQRLDEIDVIDGWARVMVIRPGEKVMTDSYWLCPDCDSKLQKWEVGE